MSRKSLVANVESTSSSDAKYVLDSEAYNNEGNRRLKNYNDLTGAVEAYTKALNISKTNYIYFNNRAVAYILLKQYDKAIADCDSSLELCKNVKAYCRKASALGQKGKHEEGISIILKALDMNPRDLESSNVLEKLLAEKSIKKHVSDTETPQGKAVKALNDKLIQKRASDLSREGVLLVRKNNFKDSIDCFTKAIALVPDSYHYYNNRAKAHKINGDYKKSLIDCETSWSIQKNIEAYNLKAILLSKSKKYDDAIDCILECLKIDPEHEESIRLHESISKDRLSRNRAPTFTLENVTKAKSKKYPLSPLKRTLTSQQSIITKLGSPINRNKEENCPWFEVPLKHTRVENAIQKGSVRILDRFEWNDLPIEYELAKKNENRKAAKTVRMKHIEKEDKRSSLRKFFTNVYITVAGILQRAMSTDSSRRASVSPDNVRRRSQGAAMVHLGP